MTLFHWLQPAAALLASISFGVLLWQWIAARRFPLHRSSTLPSQPPAITLLKPLKGCDDETAACLESWLAQNYRGQIQILFGVASPSDPVVPVIRALIAKFPDQDASLVICPESIGPNAKVSTLAQLEHQVRHSILVISDADVRVPPRFLEHIADLMRPPAVGLVNCLHCLANPSTVAMRWEAIAINADFWSQVLQGITLRPLDFALGAVMAVRRDALRQIGGFKSLSDYLADDYQLGHRIALAGWSLSLSPTVVECWEAPGGWSKVWKHQLRWARTVRVCMPAGYFFSIIGNATLWPLLWLILNPRFEIFALVLAMIVVRVFMALDCQQRLRQNRDADDYWWLIPIRDLSAVVLWALAFVGNRVEWRGQVFTVLRGGKLQPHPTRARQTF